MVTDRAIRVDRRVALIEVHSLLGLLTGEISRLHSEPHGLNQCRRLAVGEKSRFHSKSPQQGSVTAWFPSDPGGLLEINSFGDCQSDCVGFYKAVLGIVINSPRKLNYVFARSAQII